MCFFFFWGGGPLELNIVICKQKLLLFVDEIHECIGLAPPPIPSEGLSTEEVASSMHDWLMKKHDCGLSPVKNDTC